MTAPCHVLVIEDDPDLRLLLKIALGRTGRFRVDVARDAREGVAAARALVPDVVLLDMTLPDADGAAVLADLRAHEATQAVRVIVVSAEASRRSAADYVELGALGAIPKPFRPAALIAELTRLLELP